ncbi:hypothetical protein OQJ13_04125 [Legionella sp. PATHC035]|uniref:hypothetical protein n=1 Tax=Legionella sp. PATHC035 TaxID=2992040 RepID=UPI002243B984|nr:hypothetical protein [Legionella sp. PATHC035]MCW8408156.1 hypothetical protein [Legionella sp. PATHC035]
MKTIFAIVSPAYIKAGNSLTDWASYLISPLHTMAFEQVCGYSLGNEVLFFEKIEDAKKLMEDAIKGKKSDATITIQKAIVELEADDDGKITKFNKIHTVNFDKRFEQAEDHFFKAVRVPKWNERAIDAKNDVSPEALSEMNIQYEMSKKAATELTQ